MMSMPLPISHAGRTGGRVPTAAVTLIGMLIGMVLYASGASAQTAEAAQPYRGLFGGSAPAAPAARASAPVDGWAASIQTFGLWEENSEPAASSTAPAGQRTIRAYSAVLAEVSRTQTSRRASYMIRASSQFRAPAMIGGSAVDNQSLTAGIRGQLSPRTSITASQQLAYAPLYILDTSSASPLALVSGVSARSVQGVTTMTNLTSASGASLAHEISRRTSASVAYGFTWVDFTRKGTTVTTSQAQAGLTRAVQRDLVLQAKYVSMWSSTAGREATSFVHAQDAGLDVSYAPVLSRRTRLTISAFPSLKLESSSGSDASGTQLAHTRGWFGLGGSLAVDHDLSRVWRSGLRYERSWYYLPGSTLPIQSDAFGGQVSGTYRTLSTAVSAAYSHGKPDLKTGSPSHVNTLSAAARIEFRPIRPLTVFGEFRRDTMLTDGAVSTLNGLSGTTTRSSLRGGAKFDLPPYGR